MGRFFLYHRESRFIECSRFDEIQPLFGTTFFIVFKIWPSLKPILGQLNKLFFCFRRKRRYRRRALAIVKNDFHFFIAMEFSA